MTNVATKRSDPSDCSDPEMAKRVLTKALLCLAEKIQLSRRELCAILGISEASASRLYDGARFINPDSKEGELATLLLRIYRSLDTLFGGNEAQCCAWFRHHNHHIEAIPADLVRNIQGMVKVASYLDAMRGKL